MDNKYNFGKGPINETWSKFCKTLDKWANILEEKTRNWANKLLNLFGKKNKVENKESWKKINMNKTKSNDTNEVINRSKKETVSALAA
jgi:hypothetical protein